jgi:origin recognition complex subunit 5
VPFAYVDAKHAITLRHFFELALKACADALKIAGEEHGDQESEQQKKQRKQFGRCDGVNTFAALLGDLCQDSECTKLVLVLDDIDRLRESTQTLMPALARLGEIVSAIAKK